MSEELKTAEQVEVNTRREYAERLHNEILHNADMVSSYLVELCKGLKRMRDERYYAELGFDSFDDYVEKDVGIKQRQAYTYISAYEKLGDSFLQSNAHLGITRLALLTEVPAADRPDFAEDNDLANLSTREIKALVEKSKQQGEQLSLLTSERDKALETAENRAQYVESAKEEKEDAQAARRDAENARQEAEKRAGELAAELEKLKTAAPDEAALAKLKKQAEREAKKDLAEKIKAAEAKAAAAARADEEKKIQAAREEAEKAAAERIKQGFAAVEQEKSIALQRAAELEKQLKVSGNKDTVMFSYLFSEEQELVNRMTALILKTERDDIEMADKLRNALKKMLSQQLEEL